MAFSTRIRHLTFLCAALAIGAGAVVAQSSPCKSRVLPTANWSTDSGSMFRIALVPGLARHTLKGLDSEVGQWTSPSSELAYDFGAYSDTLGDSTAVSGAVCPARIGGRAARIVLFRDARRRYALAAHWRSVEGTGRDQRSLTISGYARDSTARDSLLASLWSVTFRRP